VVHVFCNGSGPFPGPADHAEILLGMKMRKHQHDALEAVHDYLAHGGMVW
jgi:hypothetical protein